MEPWDDRGQSIQIGAVLIFAALILLLSLYQATIVPQQNKQVEFDHSQQVQGDLLEFRNAVTSTFGESASRSVSIRLGTTYPSRVLAVNPPPVSGLLRTAGTTDADVSFALSNVEALDGEADDFWDSGSPREYGTGAVVYRPGYNEYGQPPRTVYDSTVLYDNFTFEGATIARSDQTLVDGSTISLVALNGSLQRSSSGATSVDVRPVSASSTTVTVTNRVAGDPVTIRTATRLPQSAWTELLADEANVTDVRTSSLGIEGFRTLEIDLRPGTYELRMAKAGVGTRVGDTSAAYMTDVAADGSTVPEDGSVRLTVEVRDKYNNPVAGVDVTGASTDTAVGTLDTDVVTTGDDGRASFQFEAKSVNAATDVPVEFNFTLDPTTPASFDPRDPEDVEAVVSVQNTQVPGGSGGGAAPYSVTWDSPTASEGGTYLSSCDDADCTWDVGSDGDSTLDLSADVTDALGTGNAVEGAEVDFAVDNSTVGTLSSSTAVSDANGDVETALSAAENGTIRLYALSGGASDTLNVTVTNVTGKSSGPTPTVGFRVDDFSDRNGNAPNFVASYDVSNTNSSFTRVEASFVASDGNPSGTEQSTATRGSLTYQPGFGDGEQYDVTLDVVYTDDNGNEYVVTSETITDTADARNPTSQNADLSESTSASLSSYTIEDRANTQSNKVRYRFDYTVSGSGSFSQVRVFALNLNSNGATGVQDRTSRSDKNVDVNPGFATGTQYRVGIAVYDADGAIVEVVDTTDSADSGGVVLTATLALLAVALVGHVVRQKSIH